MNKLFTLLGTGLFLTVMSCNNQHEVVPAPLPVADLECSCEGTIDGVFKEYNDSCKYSNEKTISSSSSHASYTTEIKNAALTEGFEIEMKEIQWLDGGNNLPTTEEWEAYFLANMDPEYYVDDNLSHNGVTIKYIDQFGTLWISDTVSGCSSIDFVYTQMELDSDLTGNYMKFKGVFNCPLRNALGDTICVENGIIKTSFKRE
jgi:hypothetical protein